MTQQYPPQGCDGPWQPPRYDPELHRQRINQGKPPRQDPDRPSQDYEPPPQPQQGAQVYPQEPSYGGYQPVRPHHRKPSRIPLYGGIAALVLIVGGGAAYALAGGTSPKPLTCPQQYQQWKTGPADAIAKRTLGTETNALTSAAKSDDIPAMDSALKNLGTDAAQLERYPMPSCADPAGYWPQMLADLKAAGDNAGSTSGLAGFLTVMAPMEKAKLLEEKLQAELARTADVKTTS
jgi:hypothetical protein